ncbi:CP9E2 protein, partial [Acromyrmex charruanus]
IYTYINMIYVIALSVIAGALGLYYFLFKDLNYFKKYGIPHKRPLPIVGNMGPTFLRLQSLSELVKTIYNLHPEAKYVGMFDMNVPLVVIRDPELIKSIALKHFDSFMDHRSFINEDQDPLFGKNLFALRGEKWRQVRSLLSPAFTSSKMKNMFKLMSACGANFGNYLAQLPPEQRILEVKDVFTRYTNDVIATCAFGVSVDSTKNPKNEFYVYGKEATVFNTTAFIKFYIFRSFPWLARLINLKIIRQKITDFFRDLIETTIKTRDENGIVRPDMLQLMMETRGKEGKAELSTDDMVAQAFVFFFAGFDSTSTLMSFAAHELAINQDVQDKLRKEIDQVLEETNGQAPYEAINSMEYLDAVINEALRMYPIAVASDRVCAKDFELPPALPGLKPFVVKKGHGIWIPTYGLQHDPNYFKEPEKFDPERFFGEQKKDNLNCGAYIPFGLGPRMCIGNRFALLETKVILFQLLARCDLKTCEKTPNPIKIAKNSFNIKPEGGFWLKVLPRKDTHHTLSTNHVNGTR